MDCADQTQSGINACAGAGFRRADRALKGVYREILGWLASDRRARQLLVTSKNAWFALRDAECAFKASSSEGGSIHPMEVSLCLEEATRAASTRLTSPDG
jgi:uncharacterized protein YecT (DUF1311 family)